MARCDPRWLEIRDPYRRRDKHLHEPAGFEKAGGVTEDCKEPEQSDVRREDRPEAKPNATRHPSFETFCFGRKLLGNLLAKACEPTVRRLQGELEATREMAAFVSSVASFNARFPGWWISCGLCGLTGHASIGPDYNSKDQGDRLRREYPDVDVFDSGFHADLAPGDGWDRVAEAVRNCIEQAETTIREKAQRDAL